MIEIAELKLRRELITNMTAIKVNTYEEFVNVLGFVSPSLNPVWSSQKFQDISKHYSSGISIVLETKKNSEVFESWSWCETEWLSSKGYTIIEYSDVVKGLGLRL